MKPDTRDYVAFKRYIVYSFWRCKQLTEDRRVSARQFARCRPTAPSFSDV